jgi:hypothetical protein
MPRPLPTSVSRGGERLSYPEGLQSEFREAVLARGLIGDIALERIRDDTADRGQLVGHEPDCRILTDACGVGVFMLAQFAAGVGDR